MEAHGSGLRGGGANGNGSGGAHVLPRTVGSQWWGCSEVAVPWGPVRSRGAPTQMGGVECSGHAGSQSGTPRRRD